MADTVLAAGGQVVGVILQALVNKELAHCGMTDLRVVGSMHERKALVADLADRFLALPGGLGTLEEFIEARTWGQFGFNTKPYGVLDVGRYFDLLLDLL